MDKVKFRRRLNNVINTLYKLPEEIRLDGYRLDMEEGLVHSPRTDFTNKCGAVHCLGGWYLLAKYWSDVDGAKGLFSNGKRDVNKGVSYTEGINTMLEDLTGDLFKIPVGWIPCDTVFDRLDVLEWLLTEEEWGNCLLAGIFFDEEAFHSDYNQRVENLQDIITHFEGVSLRLYIQELYNKGG